jgi:hypothetical protein
MKSEQDIKNWLESELINGGGFMREYKSLKATITASIIYNTAMYKNTVFLCGEPVLKFE